MTHNERKVYAPTKTNEVRFRYVPVQQVIESEDLGTYTTYGISARAVEDELFLISDVSTDFEKVRQLADLLTEQELHPEHLGDIIEDFLTDEDAVLA